MSRTRDIAGITEGVENTNGQWNFTEMPEVGGNPILESDSNSDGSWTLFSDLSVMQRSNAFSIDSDDEAGGVFRTAFGDRPTWTYPIPLASASYLAGSGNDPRAWVAANSPTSTSAQIGLLSSSSLTGVAVRVFVYGTAGA